MITQNLASHILSSAAVMMPNDAGFHSMVSLLMMWHDVGDEEKYWTLSELSDFFGLQIEDMSRLIEIMTVAGVAKCFHLDEASVYWPAKVK